MISAIVLAAGISSRMGRPKLLLPLGGKMLIQHVVDTLVMSEVNEVIVVLGAYREDIQKALTNKKVKQVINRDYQMGQGLSVAAGARSARRDACGLLFMPGDQPLITKKVINELINKFNESDKLIVRPLYGNCPGNPCIFRSNLREELEELTGERGGRTIIDKYSSEILTVSLPAGPEGLDIDTTDDFDNLCKIFYK